VSPDGEGTLAHERAIGLTLELGLSLEGGADRVASVEGFTVVPPPVRFADVRRVICAVGQQGARQYERELGVVGGLSGQRVPHAAGTELV